MRLHRPMSDPCRLRGVLVGVLAAVALGYGCSEDSNGPAGPGPGPGPGDPNDPVDISGTYALTGVRHTGGELSGGGDGLPVTFTGEGTSHTFHSGTLTLTAGGSFSIVLETTNLDEDFEVIDDGTYTHAGNSVVFTDNEFPQRLSTGTLAGNALTVQGMYGVFDYEFDLLKQ